MQGQWWRRKIISPVLSFIEGFPTAIQVHGAVTAFTGGTRAPLPLGWLDRNSLRSHECRVDSCRSSSHSHTCAPDTGHAAGHARIESGETEVDLEL